VPPSRLHPIRHGYWSVYYGRLRKLEGYHFVILCCALSGVVVILINFIFTIWAIATFGVDDGIGTLQEGDCHKTKSINFWIHLAINILSTALLSASNFAMQCLTSPTRHDIDKAHAQRKWLDVGVPSFRNLRRLSRDRVILWYLLASSSIPLHLLYNSTVFATLSTQQYNVLLVSKEFTAGSPFAVANTSFDSTSNYQAQSSASDIAKLLHKYQSNLTFLTRLENKACLDTYTSSIISTHSDLVLVSDYSNQANSYLVSNPDTNSPILPSLSGLANQWMCAMPATYAAQECQTDTQSPHPDPDHWTIKLYPPLSEYYGGGVPDQGPQNPLSQVSTNIQYCLSQPVKEQCQTQFSLGIMIAVLACNLVKVICLGYIAWKHDTEPLVTLGDAIASFLKEPDVTTGGAPLYNKSRFKGSNMWDATSTSKLSRLWGLRRLSRRRGSRWFRTISKRRWMIYGLL